jgi:hypothetical protein
MILEDTIWRWVCGLAHNVLFKVSCFSERSLGDVSEKWAEFRKEEFEYYIYLWYLSYNREYLAA